MRRSIQEVGYGDRVPCVAVCVHCQFGLAPVRLRRRWVHHFADTGTIVVCGEKNIIRREDINDDVYRAQFKSES